METNLLAEVTKHVPNDREMFFYTIGSETNDADLVWRNLFVELPSGVNKLLIEGIRSDDDEKSGILLDDLSLRPCAEKSEAINDVVETRNKIFTFAFRFKKVTSSI